MTDAPVSRIRNFCIIAHIDHGKSTLADRLLQDTGTVANRDMQEQFLDNMELERERGITIKLQAARMNYTAADGEQYVLNLIDTPGHVDFSYEVSRSLLACEGALLVVDASQGVEAQTLANVYLALENDLEIIPVLNKIDLPGADPDRIKEEVEAIIGLDCSNAINCSAKTGLGVPEILQAVVDRVPAPADAVDEPTKALIFDSYYDPYRGVIVYFRVMSGRISCKEKVLLMASKKTYELDEVGIMAPDQRKVDELHAGEVGYLAASIKAVADARVGDTITLFNAPAEEALPGYTEAKPMVFCGLFPTEADQYPDLREALHKLQLSDAALKFEPETSSAMGFGFRCGFLGLLHMEIVQERLEREYDLDLIVTAPSVIYKVNMMDGSEELIDNPATLPEPQKRESIEEPYVRMEIFAPNDYNGALMGLCQERRGEYLDMKYITKDRVTLIYELPLAEVVTDFFDQMKTRTQGYASMEYHLIGYRKNQLVRLDVLINGDRADPLTTIV
ncbi:translation elongation factor 4, partial [Synechococcus sp. AH-551-E05]